MVKLLAAFGSVRFQAEQGNVLICKLFSFMLINFDTVFRLWFKSSPLVCKECKYIFFKISFRFVMYF